MYASSSLGSELPKERAQIFGASLDGLENIAEDREPSVWEQLVAVGVQEAQRSALEQAVAAAREAQSRWTVQRDRMKSEAQQTRETAGYAVRDQLLAAGRWNLRADRVAQGALSAIAEGEGLADLPEAGASREPAET